MASPIGFTAPVVIPHALGSYPVYVDTGLLGRLEQLVAQHLPGARIALIMDSTLHTLYGSGRLGPAWSFESLTFPAGEGSKSRESWCRLTDELLERGFGRDTGIVALGGGVTGDLAGFVAATYMRGVPYIQVPTTLLAMVDASVGGKTAVDTPKGKNLVGAFHHPSAVVADPLVLGTLPMETFREGLAETVKHGLIADRKYFEWMESHVSPIAGRDPDTLAPLIRRSIEIKADVVRIDEREMGCRAILNAGHTVGHALELEAGYELPHGHAVGLGLVVECQIAEDLKIAAPGLRARVSALLAELGLPTRLRRDLETEPVIAAMRRDKKNRAGHIHLALPAAIGQMQHSRAWTTPVPDDVIGAALAVIR
jgi:3-dehydroquinate synthase